MHTNYVNNNGVKRSAFGEQLVTTGTPTIQFDAVYGLRQKTDIDITSDIGGVGGASLQSNSDGTKEFKITSGAQANTYGHLRSKRTVRYRPGQGMRFQYTARFTRGVAGNTQRAGAFNFGNELAFGYNGTSFGILYRHGGLPEIRTLTVSVGAGGSENVTITLNGVAKVVAVTAASAAVTADQIAAAVYPTWEVAALGATVIFVAQTDTTYTGAFTMTSTGVAAGTFANTSPGITSTSTWIPQSQWNVDKCNGSASGSGFTLDPTKGNVFEISSQYLGYGQVFFYIENEVGDMILVHKINYPNSNTTPLYSIPHFKASYRSENTTNTTAISLYGASYSAFVDGPLRLARNTDSRSATKTGVGTTSKPILTIRNRVSFNNTWNLTSLTLHAVSCSVDGAKNCTVEIILNAVLTGAVWTAQDATNSIVEYDTTASALTIGANSQIIHSYSLGKTESIHEHLEDYEQILEANDTITLAVKTAATTTDVVAALVWKEE